MSDLRTALSQLDPKNDAHWTGDGLPAMEAVGAGFTRKQLTQAFPNFTRRNPVLDAPPKEVEQPAALRAEAPKTVFAMESSEFGGTTDIDDEEDTPYVPPSEEEQEASRALVEETAATVAQRRAAADAARAELDAATAAHDAVIAEQEAAQPPAHVSQQTYLIHFLQATQKQKPEKSQIDKVMERKQGYGLKRPVFFPQNK